MSWFVALFARIALLVVWLSTSLVNRAFHGGWILPLLGILFLPITTLTYVLDSSISGSVTGWDWLWIALAVLLDLAAYRARGRRGKAQDSKVGIPSGLARDIRRAEQLEAQIERNPGVSVPLIQLYKQIIERMRPEETPDLYAAIQGNLGFAYAELPAGDRAHNLALAIGCYQQALRFYTTESNPLEYAGIQNNLGNIYCELPTGDRAHNLALAIECFRQALRFYTPESDPLEYARTQNNLGTAYNQLGFLGTAYDHAGFVGNWARNLALAIECYQQALRFLTPESDPHRYATAQTNLGNAYREMPTGDKAHNLALAIECYQQALRFLTPEAFPFGYATNMSNLGLAYSALPDGDRAHNLALAIECFRQALRFYTPESDPHRYTTVQNNLANAYREMPTRDRAHNLALAIECYQQALRFRTPETEPYGYRRTIGNLANLYFAQGRWNEALGAYRVAMDIGEQLYRAGLSTTSKTAEVIESAALYPNAAFAAVRCGEPTEALLILEQGKTRLLAEALRLRVRRPPHVPDAIWNAYEQAGATVRTFQAEKLDTATERHDPMQAYEMRTQAGRAANAALDVAIADVRAYAPHFLAPLDRSTLEAQLPDTKTAFIAFCITEQGSMGFAVSRHTQERVQVIEVPTFTQSDLDDLFGEWLRAYNRFLSDRTRAAHEAWQESITRVLAELGEHLFTPIVSVLSADVEHIVFLPSETLFQFPLHAIPLAGSNSELICDRYQVSYAPSIEVLTDARAKAMQEVTPELYAVINPEDDPKLLFTPFEGMAIAQLFDEPTVDGGQGGTKGRVLAGMQGRTYVHFSCHGSYQWNDPPASGLHLADDRLTLADLQQGGVDLSATRVVTLSACETGITDLFSAHAGEYVGIPAGFLLAGAACVVSSLWAVPDLSTALLMERLYHNHLKRRMGLAAALRDAQWLVRTLEIGAVAEYAEQCYQQAQRREKAALFQQMRHYRQQADQDPALRPFAHPYYWAAFTVNGW